MFTGCAHEHVNIPDLEDKNRTPDSAEERLNNEEHLREREEKRDYLNDPPLL